MSGVDVRLVFLGLGSNMGDRSEALRVAVDHIDGLACTDVLRCSSVYETEPWGDVSQDAYYNAVAEISTALRPEELLAEVLRIELEMGRVREIKYGPRRIDIDILLYGDSIVEHDEITIPHPRIAERNFVLVPLEELNPDLLHPVMRHSIAELRAHCPDTGGIQKTDIRLGPEAATT